MSDATDPSHSLDGTGGTPDAPGPADEAHAQGEDAQAAGPVDPDAWANACAEDLEAEKARRRTGQGARPGAAADELRKLVDAVADKLSGLQSPLFGAAAGGAAQQLVNQFVQQAKAAVEPVIERNPEVFDHLAAAGSELLAAYRSAVETQERRWTRGPGPRDDGPAPGEHIDLD
jgi:Family of unknown function (DUF5304)